MEPIETFYAVGSVIFFIGFFYLCCRCSHKGWGLREGEEDYNEENEFDSEGGMLTESRVNNQDNRADNNDTGSNRRITLTINGVSRVELPMGAETVSLAQQLIELHNRSHDSTVTSIMRVERNVSNDLDQPPNYGEVASSVSINLPSSSHFPNNEISNHNDPPPPNYDEATALALPPPYDDIK